MLRLLVCGGRAFTDRDAAFAALDRVHAERGVAVLIHGAARGADTFGGEWAAAHGVPVLAFHADWDGLGRKAGPIRNQQMLDEGRPDLVLALPGGRGTADMVRRAMVAGVAVILVGETAPATGDEPTLPRPLTPAEMAEKLDYMDCRVPTENNPVEAPGWFKEELARVKKIAASRKPSDPG